MSFNADAVLAAMTPWQFTTGGHAYTARPVSSPRVGAYLASATGTPKEFRRALEQLLREAFPWRLSYQWRGDPVRVILAMPPAQLAATLAEFFAAQGLTPHTLRLALTLHSAPR